MNKKTPILLTITGPSGVGKDTVTDIIIQKSNFRRLGTYTTRPMREGEIEGDHHFYVTPEEFEKLDAKEKFEDHIVINKIHYAIATDKIREALAQGENLILVIQVNGVRMIRKHYPEAISVYLLPPSEEANKERFKERGDAEKDMKARMKEDGPLKDTSEFDFVVVNETGKPEHTAGDILNFVKTKSQTSFSK